MIWDLLRCAAQNTLTHGDNCNLCSATRIFICLEMNWDVLRMYLSSLLQFSTFRIN